MDSNKGEAPIVTFTDSEKQCLVEAINLLQQSTLTYDASKNEPFTSWRANVGQLSNALLVAIVTKKYDDCVKARQVK